MLKLLPMAWNIYNTLIHLAELGIGLDSRFKWCIDSLKYTLLLRDHITAQTADILLKA